MSDVLVKIVLPSGEHVLLSFAEEHTLAALAGDKCSREAIKRELYNAFKELATHETKRTKKN